MKQRAFSIVELLIAVTIIGMVSAISLPAYNTFSAQFDLQRDGLSVTDCIAKAVTMARTRPVGYGRRILEGQQDPALGASADALSEGRLRYAEAIIVQQSNVVTCSLAWYTGKVTSAQLQAASTPALEMGSLGTDLQIRNVFIASSSARTDILPTTRTELYFDGAKGGELVLARGCTSVDGTTGCTSVVDTDSRGVTYKARYTRGPSGISLDVPALSEPLKVRSL